MRERIAASAAALTLAAVLLINFRAPDDQALGIAIKPSSTAAPAGTADPGSSSSNTTSPGSTGSTGGATPAASPAATGGSTSTASGTYSGPVAANQYGDVQVQVTIQNGKITDVQALSLPSGGHSGRISDYVGPILRSQALSAQSASIDGVSGATYTSQAYAQSLQGALDAAGL
jgi:uncharacterized protein with FMN-binding domain